MTVPVFKQDQFISFIKQDGWEIESNIYWEEYNRLIFTKDGQSFTFQCKERYFYPEVVETCKLHGITPPQDHSHSYYLHFKMHDELCYCGEDRFFKDCCGKKEVIV